MNGRGRNTPHRNKKKHRESGTGDPNSPGTPTSPEEEGDPETAPVPRVCMDYFYLSSRSREHSDGPQSMSTKELRLKLQQMGKSSVGARNVLIKRYQLYSDEPVPSPDEVSGEGDRLENSNPQANDHPMMVMVDESTGNKYMRAVDHKGLGPVSYTH